ncbi:MAG: acyl-CoA thioesterase [Planctomycetaceae bacterium]|nr:acyl-CoA thioesterase [Planctomycetaceae bacterium]
MPALFEHSRRVRSEEIDRQGHANNVAFVQWMQEAALAHSAEQGWPAARYRDAGYSWVARSHYIEYRRPAFEDDELLIRTWVATMDRCSSVRRYQMVRAADGQLLAVAETNWAFVALAEEKLARIPAEVSSAFELLDRGMKAV